MQQAGLWLVSLIAAVHRGAALEKKKKSFLPLAAIVRAELTHLKEVRGSCLCWRWPPSWHVCVCEQADVVKSFVFFFFFFFLLGNWEMLKHQQQATELDPAAEDLCVHPSLIMQEECC